MIKSVEVYLVTNGNGQEAVAFYQDALNAKVESLALYGDNWPECPEELKNYVMNAQLDINGTRLMLSDNNPQMPFIQGNNMTAAIITDDVETATNVYNKLKVNAQEISMELAPMPWSPAYANLTDQYGINWQINTEITA